MTTEPPGSFYILQYIYVNLANLTFEEKTSSLVKGETFVWNTAIASALNSISIMEFFKLKDLT